jgi:hypothetical protein
MLKSQVPSNEVQEARPSARSLFAIERGAPTAPRQPTDSGAEAEHTGGRWLAFLRLVMKGFELYGASLYPAELLLEVPPSTDVVSPSDRAGGRPDAMIHELEGSRAYRKSRSHPQSGM